jgi:hypothetical protein
MIGESFVTLKPAQELGRVLGVGYAGMLAPVEVEPGLFQGPVQTFWSAAIKFLVRPFLKRGRKYTD